MTDGPVAPANRSAVTYCGAPATGAPTVAHVGESMAAGSAVEPAKLAAGKYAVAPTSSDNNNDIDHTM